MITQSELKKLLHYNPETGIFTKPVSKRSNKSGLTTVVGSKHHSGYLSIKIKNKAYQIHRLAYLYMKGYIPKFVDHINHIRDDNRWINLRAVSKQGNAQNQSMYSSNKSGHTGVNWCKTSNRWKAQISINKKGTHIGHFVDLSDAIAARKAAEVKYGYHENHGLSKS